MTKNRGRYGDGAIDQRGDDVWRLRYRAGGKRVAVTVRGTKRDAQKELRRLIRSADTGEHVEPDRITFGQWAERWLKAGCPGRKQKQVTRHSWERYEAMLRCHVLPTLGARPLQQIRSDEIDALYIKLKEKTSSGRQLSERSIFLVHVVLGACLNAAVRKKILAVSPMAHVEKVPSPPESDHGVALDETQLNVLMDGFRNSTLHSLIVTAVRTGARRNELLALQWDDLDIKAKTLRIERSLDRTREGLALKDPKTARGKRTIAIDDDLLALLVAERERHLRIAAGVPDGVQVDLSLVRLPEGALIFPGAPKPGEGFSFTSFRNPGGVTKRFQQRAAKLGFPGIRFHDLRGSHATLLLNKGVPVHTVASRLGHDAAMLLRAYAKRTQGGDASAAAAIARALKGS
jgi:integrase